MNGLPRTFREMRETPFGTYFELDEALSRWAAEHPGVKEIIDHDLYSYVAYAAAGQTILRTFNQNIGSAAEREDDTNLERDNTLPGDQVKIVRSIGIFFELRNDATLDSEFQTGARDFVRALGRGRLTFTISHKDQFQTAPLWALPCGFGAYGPAWASVDELEANATVRAAGQLIQNALPAIPLDPVIIIPPQRHFEVTLEWAAVQANAVAGRIGVNLHGPLLRAVQ